MKRARQLKAFKLQKSDVFGGALLKGNAKKARFIPRTLPMHITLKSDRAKGRYSMLNHDRHIRLLIEKQARLAGIKLYDFVNVGNHIHILAQFHNRILYRRFIRSITGLIARKVLAAERGSASLNGKKFWTYRPYSKIIHAGKRHYQNVRNYMAKNRAELFGVNRKWIEAKDPVSLSFLEIIKDWDSAFTEKVLC